MTTVVCQRQADSDIPSADATVTGSLSKLLGHTHIFLQSLWWLIPIDITSPVLDYRGRPTGKLSVSIRVASEQGTDLYLPGQPGVPGEYIMQFEGKNVRLEIEIIGVTGLPRTMQNYFLRYVDFLDESQEVPLMPLTGPTQVLTLTVDKGLENKLLSETLCFQVWGSPDLNFLKPGGPVDIFTLEEEDVSADDEEADVDRGGLERVHEQKEKSSAMVPALALQGVAEEAERLQRENAELTARLQRAENIDQELERAKAANIALQAQVQKLEDEQRRRHEQLQASSIAGKDGENGHPKSRACVLM